MTVLVPETEFPFVGLPASRKAVVQLVGAGLVVGMQQMFPGADVRFDFPLGIAEHVLPSRRVHHRAGLDVPVPHAFLRTGERQGEAFFILTKDRFGPLAFRDVAHDHLDRVAVRIVEPRGVDLHVGDAADQPDDLLFGRRHRLTGHHPADAFANEGVALGMKDVEGGLAQYLLRRGGAEETHRRGVQEYKPVVLADQDAVRR